MAYATVQNAIDRYGEQYVITSCDRDNDGDLDTAAFELALDDATDMMDSYLIGRYTLPLDSVPRVFIKYCCDIAIFFLSENAGTMTNEKRDRMTRATTWLEQVGEGKRRLVRAGEASSSKNHTLAAQISTQHDQSTERAYGSRRWTRDVEESDE